MRELETLVVWQMLLINQEAVLMQALHHHHHHREPLRRLNWRRALMSSGRGYTRALRLCGPREEKGKTHRQVVQKWEKERMEMAHSSSSIKRRLHPLLPRPHRRSSNSIRSKRVLRHTKASRSSAVAAQILRKHHSGQSNRRRRYINSKV